jgi:hypothetical protein
MKQFVKFTVDKCTRFGKKHFDVMFELLRNPPPEFDYWALCPLTQQPMLLKLPK